jgi:SAM-dependent methyltransferase/FKBP-type peptidyl-prolyl cis-trans isomerase 2
MSRINSKTTTDLFFQIKWRSDGVTHTDAFAGHQINLWRDILPDSLHDSLMGKQVGEMVHLTLTTDELLGSNQHRDIKTVDRKQFCGDRVGMELLEPRIGRFYPKGILLDVAGIFKANMTPLRCINQKNGRLDMAMGHPMAGRSMDVDVTVGSIYSTLEERGGTSRNWGEIITEGIGMQARWDALPTDFFSGQPFARKDASPDGLFFAQPRLVQHIDDAAAQMVRRINGRFLNKRSTVLDLMSSWQSHLPESANPAQITGLGLNKTELHKNEALTSYVVHDLNAVRELPFENNVYDVVICNLSVEYLIHPKDIFKEVARVLKPGGIFVVNFSNRWFEPKVIRIWTEIHQYERVGLVLEYFRAHKLFDNLHTYSIRGLSRPPQDKYYHRIAYADPVHAVWARCK